MPVMGTPMMGQVPLTGVQATTGMSAMMPTQPMHSSPAMSMTSHQQTTLSHQANGGNKQVPLDPFGAL